MASAALELLGFFLGLIGMLGTLVATVLPYWRISAHIGSNIVTAVANMRGLWMECVYQSTGAFQCETYNSMLALPSDLQASRALMVISVVLSILAVAISVLGMQCTLCLDGAGTVKSRVAGAGGGLFLAAGFMALIPVSWTTHEVVQTFYRQDVLTSMKFELGECLYVGLASALISMLGGGLLCVSCCDEQDGGRGRRPGGGGYPYPVVGGVWRAQGYGQPHRPIGTPQYKYQPAGGRRWYVAPVGVTSRVHTRSREPRSPPRQDMTSQDMYEVTITPSPPSNVVVS